MERLSANLFGNALAGDFFSKRVWTLHGPRQIFAMAFIHLATRRVFVTPGTFKPDAAWMESQARAFLDPAAAERLSCSIVTGDYDGKFSKEFDQLFKNRSIQVKPVGPQAPNSNAFIERWIQSLEYEALNHFIVFGKNGTLTTSSQNTWPSTTNAGRIKEWVTCSCRDREVNQTAQLPLVAQASPRRSRSPTSKARRASAAC